MEQRSSPPTKNKSGAARKRENRLKAQEAGQNSNPETGTDAALSARALSPRSLNPEAVPFVIEETDEEIQYTPLVRGRWNHQTNMFEPTEAPDQAVQDWKNFFIQTVLQAAASGLQLGWHTYAANQADQAEQLAASGPFPSSKAGPPGPCDPKGPKAFKRPFKDL